MIFPAMFGSSNNAFRLNPSDQPDVAGASGPAPLPRNGLGEVGRIGTGKSA